MSICREKILAPPEFPYFGATSAAEGASVDTASKYAANLLPLNAKNTGVQNGIAAALLHFSSDTGVKAVLVDSYERAAARGTDSAKASGGNCGDGKMGGVTAPPVNFANDTGVKAVLVDSYERAAARGTGFVTSGGDCGAGSLAVDAKKNGVTAPLVNFAAPSKQHFFRIRAMAGMLDAPRPVAVLIASYCVAATLPAARTAEPRTVPAIWTIGSVTKAWRRIVKELLAQDEGAWLTATGSCARVGAACLRAFPLARAIRFRGDVTLCEIGTLLTGRSVQKLDLARNRMLRAFKPLPALIDLRELNLHSTALTDAAGLSLLCKLLRLDLSGTGVVDLRPLAALLNLETLYLSNTRVRDVTALRGLVHLQNLHLANTEVSDVRALGSLTKLRMLILSGTAVANMSGLCSLIELHTLDLCLTRVVDLTSIGRIVTLRTLHLGYTQVSNVRPLSALVDLRVLNLMRSRVADVSSLSSLLNLRVLHLWCTPVSNVDALCGLNNLTIIA